MRKNIFLLSLVLAVSTACTTADPKESAVSLHPMVELNQQLQAAETEDPYWTTYEVFLYSYYDSNGDGIGDINGLKEKLDYISEMGFNAIWMMPIHPSPTYHKYDVTDYKAIDPVYGTMEDFEKLEEACEEKGIRLIMDLVLNHTSSQHPWFLEAVDALRNNYESKYINYYHFSDSAQDGYAQIPDTGIYYEARFWDGMPDLNLDNPDVRNEILDIVSFWKEKGIDGFRLDAVTSYYTGRDSENIAFLQWLKENTDTYYVAEAWTNQETYASYYGSGLDSFFDFAFGDQSGVIASTVTGSYGADDYIHAQTKEQELYKSYNSNAVNAPFYTNHDMARGAGYYAGDDGSRTKMALGLNLLMSGNAFLYYGDELGMKGSGKDENKRAPMYWSEEGPGMCSGPEGMDEINMKFPSLEEQEKDEYSIYQYVRQAVHVRNAFPEIMRGEVEEIPSLMNEEAAAYIKKYGDSSILIALNTSDQAEELDISDTGYANLAAMLIVDEQAVTLKDGKITLPPYSIAVVKP